MSELERMKQLYIDDLRSNRKSENTIKNYEGVLNRLIRYCKHKSINIDFSDTNQFKQALLAFKSSINIYYVGGAKEGREVQYIETSINTYRSCMRSFITYLHKSGYIADNFSDTIESVKTNVGKKKEVLNYEDLSIIKNMLDKEVAESNKERVFITARNRFIFWLLVTTGIREEEAANLEWSNIDVAKGKRIYIDKGKGRKSRYVPIMSQFHGAMYDYQTIIAEQIVRGYEIESKYVLCSYRKHDKPMTKTNIYNIVKDIIRRAGIEKKISPHNLRHTFASIAIDKKVKLPTLSNWLGHANPNVTAQVYIHELSEAENAEEMQKLDGALPL